MHALCDTCGCCDLKCCEECSLVYRCCPGLTTFSVNPLRVMSWIATSGDVTHSLVTQCQICAHVNPLCNLVKSSVGMGRRLTTADSVKSQWVSLTFKCQRCQAAVATESVIKGTEGTGVYVQFLFLLLIYLLHRVSFSISEYILYPVSRIITSASEVIFP